jgi:adenosylhomocysteine nucleosidase
VNGSKIGIVAALEREVKPAIKEWQLTERAHGGRRFRFFENERCVLVCGGIGAEAARRAAEAIIALYRPQLLISAGFAGALDQTMEVGQIFLPRRVTDAGDGSTHQVEAGDGTLVSFGSIATREQKQRLASAYCAQAVDMEAAAVARAAQLHGILFQAVKAISDDKNFDMPELDNFIKDGQFSTTMFVATSVIRPWLWPGIMRLAKNSAKAAKTLSAWLDRYNNGSRVPGESNTRTASN